MTEPRATYRATDLGDLINALPALFGFPPEDSLVALGTEGSRIVFGMRLDLAGIEADAVETVAELVVSHLEHQQADGAIVIAVGEPLMLGRCLVLAVEARLVRVRPVAGGWATNDRYWVSMDAGSPRGRPYRRSLDHPAALRAVWEGQQIAPSREAIMASMRPVDGDRRTELDALADRMNPVTGGAVADDLVERVFPILHDLRNLRPVTDEHLLRLGFLLCHIPLRDAACELMSTDNAPEFVRVWLHVARHVPLAWAPAAYSLAAYASWLSGDGAKAVMAAEQALRIDEGYSMASLLIDLATSGVNPRVPGDA